ncbi:hypothetical protein ACFC06_21655 [Nocardia sp. NPDC056064]|uniref:hypothetical protein n=1 Tax=Nocardia sp. NPDC056064 TaxID=3345701 RepID=UPI0035DBB0E8
MITDRHQSDRRGYFLDDRLPEIDDIAGVDLIRTDPPLLTEHIVPQSKAMDIRTASIRS